MDETTVMNISPQALVTPARPKLTLRGTRQPKAAPDVDQFAFNWRVGNRKPSKRFTTVAEALTEAARIRKLYPDATIVTYQAVAIVEVSP